MKRPATILLSLWLLIGTGCSAPVPEGRHLAVDGFLATEHPDSARRLLQAMNPERMSRNDRARWSLMLGLAEVAAGDTLTGKEALDRGMRYYDRHGSDSERAAAWYTYAQAHVKAGNLEEGIRGYTQAAILAEKALAGKQLDDSLRRGTETLLVAVYHTLGLHYFEQGYDAVEPFSKAVEAARANGNKEQEGYSRFMLASSYCANGDYEQAVKTLEPLVEAADTIQFRYFAQQIRLQNLIFHTYLGDWTPEQLLEARKGIDLKVIRRAPLSYGSASSEDTGRSFYDVASAIIFQRDGQLDSARRYIEESLACRDTFHQGDVGLFDLAAEIYHDRGDDSRAYDYLRQYVSVKDSLFEAQRGAQVAELERRYRTANEVALREASLRYRAWIAALVALLVIMAAGWAVVSYRRKLRRRDEQLSESLALVDSYRESHDSLTSRLDASDAREAAVKRLLEGRVAAVRDIAATYYTFGEGERLTAKMKELALSPAMLADVVDMADLYSDRAVTRLREQLPGWTTRNYDFAALVIAGFTPQEISVLLGMSLNGVYSLKSKLKRRIAESDAVEREILLGLFS
ncbi:MAG TPA: hypothetical protein H9828_03140 [Candidatus Alistipes intestinigallinarum]|uniref:Tetratricopeptide repeat protein n=1 Tax=Candidatus Alistipes intestinigallinarum TaxID=2838440 RepID=A0A9D1YZH6_9BACT|nr:hypothetical protein [Candidatus Alistipes intestinigallinarum]